ncbi:asparagine synthase (glutamine-hydrolysing) [Pricia antarctica]|uniref:asparagine synthase (glutamine-hydrolyzing) n=1 Tax=Pricia antarctica TaxID=641691 RepID=A0A1G6YPZ0_9FLAO|nr:asparagine synthase (glutamine-hydrolyzing) [Pricia antarctica]SDD92458.1 asparagine synthase (glutamine-hydrolysing) [Pricia antarctica]
MCGICGKFYFDPGRSVLQEDVHKMAKLITHRGPDDSGYYIKGNIGFGFRRLSIIDLYTGHQPLSNEDGTVWIVLNGEIYNHLELREQLITKGHKFSTKTDTETIVHLFEEYGSKCVQHLRGMFAFAIWDEKNKKLFCARDRFGIKPFFYHNNEEGFVFGSEIKCVLSQTKSSSTLSIPMLDQYLTYGYSSEEGTIYQNIKKLRPGHTLEIEHDGKVKVNRYWDIHYTPDYNKTEEEWCKLIDDKLSESVKVHLMSDVPLGAFLSGGVDSSAIVALMSKNSNAPVKTFSIGFKEAEFNELKYAREVAKMYNTEHYEQIVEPESVALLPDLVDIYDEPFSDASAIPTYFVSKFARENVTVVLSGDGGDELFAGYNRYQRMMNMRNFNILPEGVSKNFWGGLHKMIPNSVKGKGATYYLSKPKDSFPAFHSIWHQAEREKLFKKELWEDIKQSPAELSRIESFTNSGSTDFLFNMQKMDMQRYMVDDVLTKVDRASMQNSLEVRVPILDHEFAELTATIPSELKLKGNIKKYIFKEAMKKHLPESIISHKKMGFSLPLKAWFKDDLKEYVNDRLIGTKGPLYDYLEPAYVNKIVNEHNNGMRDFNDKIWSLLFLDQWLNSRKE